ncbi:MAG: hypothetical protein RIR73_2971 [Chloroflexota bacterium]|jgi:uncharacterized protein (DUF433 family)
MFDLSLGITVDPSVRFGKPVIKGTRVPVDTVVARVASGMNIKDIAEEYGITEKDIYNSLHYAASK